MPIFNYLYVREQRARTTIEAENEAEARSKAEAWMGELDLGDGKDDESDDPGDLVLEEE